jgi:hypothetical protein
MSWLDIQDSMVNDLELNLDKILNLTEKNQIVIMKLFDDLMDSFYGERGVSIPGGEKIDYLRASMIYKTLLNNDFLITKRERNLNKVLEN